MIVHNNTSSAQKILEPSVPCTVGPELTPDIPNTLFSLLRKEYEIPSDTRLYRNEIRFLVMRQLRINSRTGVQFGDSCINLQNRAKQKR